MSDCEDTSNWEILNEQVVQTALTLFRTHNHIWEINHKIVDQYRLTWAQFVTLSALRQSPPPHRLLPTRLYDAVQVSSGGLTKILEGLKTKGLISRSTNPSDRRGQFAQLTPAGIKQIEKIMDELNEYNKIIFNKALSSDEQTDLGELLGKLCKEFDQDIKAIK